MGGPRIGLGWVLGRCRSALKVLGFGLWVTWGRDGRGAVVGHGGCGAVVGLGGRGLWDVWVWVLVGH